MNNANDQRPTDEQMDSMLDALEKDLNKASVEELTKFLESGTVGMDTKKFLSETKAVIAKCVQEHKESL